MKERKHQNNDYELALERLETTIESIDPDTTVSVDDIFKMAEVTNTNRAARNAATMLMRKYGITYKE